jgi:hypothetical protein
MSNKFPKTLFVSIGNEGTNDEFLDAVKKAEKLDDGKVAIYELKEVKTKTTEIHLN